MPRILHFTAGPQDWQALLADPQKHWRTGFSARTLAHCWESAQGLPPEVQAVFASSDEPLLADFTPIIAVPEFKVPLPGGDRPSQNDLFLLGRSKAGPVSVMVEGKVSESFRPTIADWRKDAFSGKEDRLSFLLRTVGLSNQAFLQLFGVRAEVGVIQRLPGAQRVPLFAAWVLGDCKFLSA